MTDAISDALKKDRFIDITTIGRKSGLPRRIEIWFHNLEDALFITGSPGARDWYANLLANPRFTFHLKGSTKADIPARATPILDTERRRAIITRIRQQLGRGEDQVEQQVAGSPLVQVTLKL